MILFSSKKLPSVLLSLKFGAFEFSFNSFIDWVLELREQIKIPHTILESAKISDQDIEKMSPMALEDPSTPGNPKKLTLEDMKLLYKYSLEGKLF